MVKAKLIGMLLLVLGLAYMVGRVLNIVTWMIAKALATGVMTMLVIVGVMLIFYGKNKK